MIVQACTKYNFGDKVAVIFEKYRPGLLCEGRVEGVKTYQSHHMVEPMISYRVSPIELEGLEHDDDEWIFEESIKGKL